MNFYHDEFDSFVSKFIANRNDSNEVKEEIKQEIEKEENLSLYERTIKYFPKRDENK